MSRDVLFDFSNKQHVRLISAAADLYHLTRESLEKTPLPGNRSTSLAIATIVHSVAAIEATANAIGHDFLFDEHHREFIPRDGQNVAMEILRAAWARSLSTVKKLQFIHSQYNATFPESTASNLEELAKYRNWLVHGYIFRTQLLLEFEDDRLGILKEHDRVDSVNWKDRFPHLKLSPLDSVSPNDAKNALRMMLQVLCELAGASSQHFEILYFCGDTARVFTETGKPKEFEEVLLGTSKTVFA